MFSPNSWGLPPRCLQRWGWWSAGGRDFVLMFTMVNLASLKKRYLQKLKVEDEMQNSFQSCFLLLEETIGFNHDFADLLAGRWSCNRNPATSNCGRGSLRMVMKTPSISHVGRVDFMPLHMHLRLHGSWTCNPVLGATNYISSLICNYYAFTCKWEKIT